MVELSAGDCVVAVDEPNTAVEIVGVPASTTAPLPVVPLDKSLAASCPTVIAAPEDTCFSTLDAAPVADKSAFVPP